VPDELRDRFATGDGLAIDLDAKRAWLRRTLRTEGFDAGRLYAEVDIAASLLVRREILLTLVLVNGCLTLAVALGGYFVLKRMPAPTAALAGYLALKGMLPPIAEVDELLEDAKKLIRLRRERGISFTRMMKEIVADAARIGDWRRAFRIAVRKWERRP
jgi:hypothetical protein